MLLGHEKVDTTLGYARLYDGTVAADYYRAMEKGRSVPYNATKGTNINDDKNRAINSCGFRRQ